MLGFAYDSGLVQLQGTSLGIAIPSPLWGEGEGEGNGMRFQPPSPPSSPAEAGEEVIADSQRGRLVFALGKTVVEADSATADFELGLDGDLTLTASKFVFSSPRPGASITQ